VRQVAEAEAANQARAEAEKMAAVEMACAREKMIMSETMEVAVRRAKQEAAAVARELSIAEKATAVVAAKTEAKVESELALREAEREALLIIKERDELIVLHAEEERKAEA